MLNGVLKNYNLPGHKRVKSDLYIHNKAISKTEEGDIDVKQFIDDISQEPQSIISTGNKKCLSLQLINFIPSQLAYPHSEGWCTIRKKMNFML